VTGKSFGYARRNAIAFLALFVALGGSAYAAAGGFASGSGVITGCVKSKGGALVVVKAGKRCPKHTTTLPFNQQGKTGEQGPPGPRGSTGATGNAGTAPPGTTVITDPPGWAPTTTSDLLLSSISTDWDEYYNENAPLSLTFQTLPITLAQFNGTATKLSSFSFCYGTGGTAGTSKLTSVEVDAVNEPATITSGRPPGGTTTTALIKQTTTLDTQGCPTFTPTSIISLSASMFLVAHVNWSGTASNGPAIYLGRTSYTFSP
jgi:hypothetical protein